MDISEQPAVWPPALDIASPEPPARKHFQLFVPDWARYWGSYGIMFVPLSYAAKGLCDTLRLHYPLWASFPAVIAAGFIVGGLITAWKYKPKWMRNKH